MSTLKQETNHIAKTESTMEVPTTSMTTAPLPEPELSVNSKTTTKRIQDEFCCIPSVTHKTLPLENF